jgi:hypothetical protein
VQAQLRFVKPELTLPSPPLNAPQQTISDALDSFGLGRNTAAHFGFPHADLAIMVEIG